MSGPVPRTLALGRIEGLDGWRAGLMIGGVLLHASSWLGSRPLFEVVNLLSHTFRMGAFFAISGFFAARSLAGRRPLQWLGRRSIQVGFPALFGLGVLCPLITVTVAAMPDQHPHLLFNWYHLWFLVALLLYAPLAALAEWGDRRYGLWRSIGRYYLKDQATLGPLLAGIGLLSFLLILVTSLVIGGIGTADTMPLLAGWRSIASYWPDFFLGFAASRSLALQQVMLRDWRSPTVVLGALGLSYALWFLVLAPHVPPDTRLWIDGMLPLVGQAAAPPAVFAFILRSSARVKRLGPGLRLFADGAFTVYLLHVPVIAILSLVATRLPASPEARYGAIIVITLALTTAFHHWVVSRSAWLSLLFCGKPLEKKRVGDMPLREPPSGRG